MSVWYRFCAALTVPGEGGCSVDFGKMRPDEMELVRADQEKGCGQKTDVEFIRKEQTRWIEKVMGL